MRYAYAVCVVLAFVALEQCASRHEPTAPGSTVTPMCAKPTNTQGQRLYETIGGEFVERHIDQGGGYLIVMKPAGAAGNQSVVVTREVFDALSGVPPSRMITLFAYVGSAVSGASPPFSCVEL